MLPVNTESCPIESGDDSSMCSLMDSSSIRSSRSPVHANTDRRLSVSKMSSNDASMSTSFTVSIVPFSASSAASTIAASLLARWRNASCRSRFGSLCGETDSGSVMSTPVGIPVEWRIR